MEVKLHRSTSRPYMEMAAQIDAPADLPSEDPNVKFGYKAGGASQPVRTILMTEKSLLLPGTEP
jgi:hypothetical protein